MTAIFHPEATSHNHYPGRFFEHIVVPRLLEEMVESALDIGSGEFCRHAMMLSEKGIRTDVFDVEEQVAKMDHYVLLKNHIKAYSAYSRIPADRYEAVLLNYVLNVIPEKEERETLLEKAVSRADKFLMLSVRGKELIRFFCRNAERHNDGYILVREGMKTFNTAYEERDMEAMIAGKGMEIVDAECNGISLQYLCRKS